MYHEIVLFLHAEVFLLQLPFETLLETVQILRHNPVIISPILAKYLAGH